MLKLHQNDGGIGLNTNHFKYANTHLHFHVAFLLSAIVCHGSVPDDFLLCTTIPLPKGNKTISGNYRGITLSSVFGRLIDVLILLRYSDVLGSCDLQFFFQSQTIYGNVLNGSERGDFILCKQWQLCILCFSRRHRGLR